jgi:hypothetical protein
VTHPRRLITEGAESMPEKPPLSFNPVWLIRLGIVVALGFGLFLKFGGLPNPAYAQIEGRMTVFRPAWWTPLIFVLPAFVIGLIVTGLWMVRGTIARVIAVCVAAANLFFLALTVPLAYVHRAELTHDRFWMRIGGWLDPREYIIPFDDVASAEIVPDDEAKSPIAQNYLLECVMKPEKGGGVVDVPINDMGKLALRGILERLRARNVELGDPFDGQVVPDELARWAR